LKYNNKDLTYFEIFKPVLIFALSFAGLVLWITGLVIIGINGKITNINILSGYMWTIFFSFCISYWGIIQFVFPKFIIKNKVIIDNVLGINKSRIIGMIYSFFWGTTLFFLFFLTNVTFSSEYYEVRCNSIDAWKVKADKNMKEYLMLEAGDDFNSYIYSSRNNKLIEWGFDSIENTENFKGYFWRNYNSDFLIKYFLEAKYIDIIVQKGVFGIDIIDKVIIKPSLQTSNN